jgi:hypothetical protein
MRSYVFSIAQESHRYTITIRIDVAFFFSLKTGCTERNKMEITDFPLLTIDSARSQLFDSTRSVLLVVFPMERENRHELLDRPWHIDMFELDA